MFVHPPAVRQAVHAQIALGLNDCEISRRLGVPRTTVRDWRRPRYQRKHMVPCPRCGRLTRRIVLEAELYSELLGLYLGDGHISPLARTTTQTGPNGRVPAIHSCGAPVT